MTRAELMGSAKMYGWLGLGGLASIGLGKLLGVVGMSGPGLALYFLGFILAPVGVLGAVPRLIRARGRDPGWAPDASAGPRRSAPAPSACA